MKGLSPQGAVGKKTGNKAMVVPPHMNEEEGCMEMVYWWKPDPKSAAELKLVVRAYSNKSRQLTVCTCLHTKGDAPRRSSAGCPRRCSGRSASAPRNG